MEVCRGEGVPLHSRPDLHNGTCFASPNLLLLCADAIGLSHLCIQDAAAKGEDDDFEIEILSSSSSSSGSEGDDDDGKDDDDGRPRKKRKRGLAGGKVSSCGLTCHSRGWSDVCSGSQREYVVHLGALQALLGQRYGCTMTVHLCNMSPGCTCS